MPLVLRRGHCWIIIVDEARAGYGRRATGQQAKVRVAHVAAESVHRRPDQVQSAAGRPALDERRQCAPHGYFRVVNAHGLTVLQVSAPD